VPLKIQFGQKVKKWKILHFGNTTMPESWNSENTKKQRLFYSPIPLKINSSLVREKLGWRVFLYRDCSSRKFAILVLDIISIRGTTNNVYCSNCGKTGTYTSLLTVYLRTDRASGAIHFIGSRPCTTNTSATLNHTHILQLCHLQSNSLIAKNCSI